MSRPETATRSEFAVILGCKPGYVTQLAKAGRLVFTDDGKRIRVADSLRRIEDTRDPDKIGVSDRHAATRAAAAERAAAERAVAAGQSDDDDDDDDGDDDARRAGMPGRPEDPEIRQLRRAKRTKAEYDALGAQLDYEERIGKLVSADEVRAVASAMGAAVRRRLEALPQILAAHVHDNDRDRIYRVAADHVEQALGDLAQTFQRNPALRVKSDHHHEGDDIDA